MNEHVAERWFSIPNIEYVWIVPACSLLLAVAELRATGDMASRARAFLIAMGLFVTAYVGMAISLWPMVIPHHYTVWQASADPGTQVFLMIGLVFLLPVILMYTGWSYWVFRGKVHADIGY